jgi:large subunit ribosomal protein L22
MEVKAIYRTARISAFKCREVTREIQGLSAAAALDLVNFCPKKAARLVGKTLRSAIANAENNSGMAPEKLVVKEAVVGEGPTIKRFIPKARGSAGPIRKRTSHIRIILSDDPDYLKRGSRAEYREFHGLTRSARRSARNASAAAASGVTENVEPAATEEIVESVSTHEPAVSSGADVSAVHENTEPAANAVSETTPETANLAPESTSSAPAASESEAEPKN